MLRAILFDLDNTLLDFLTFKRETARAAARAMVENGMPATEKEVYDRIFAIYDEKGIEYQKTFYGVVKPFSLGINNAEKIQQAGIVAYLKRKFEVLKPYPEVKPTLAKLRENGLKLGVVSDAPRNKAWQRLVLTGLQDEFEVVVTHSDTLELKPHPSPFRLALEKLGMKSDEVLFVGDNPARDIKGAKAIGMKTCLAKYGQVFKGETKADYEIERVEGLADLIVEIN